MAITHIPGQYTLTPIIMHATPLLIYSHTSVLSYWLTQVTSTTIIISSLTFSSQLPTYTDSLPTPSSIYFTLTHVLTALSLYFLSLIRVKLISRMTLTCFSLFCLSPIDTIKFMPSSFLRL